MEYFRQQFSYSDYFFIYLYICIIQIYSGYVNVVKLLCPSFQIFFLAPARKQVSWVIHTQQSHVSVGGEIADSDIDFSSHRG